MINSKNFFFICCPQCNEKRSISFSYLVRNFQKILAIPCKKCGFKTKLKVNKRLIDEMTRKLQNKSEFNVLRLKLSYLYNGSLPEIDIAMKTGLNIIGRSPDSRKDSNKISLYPIDPYISRNHLVVKMISDDIKYKYTVRDMNSTNGVYLNNRKINVEDEIYLKADDVISIGKSLIKIKSDV